MHANFYTNRFLMVGKSRQWTDNSCSSDLVSAGLLNIREGKQAIAPELAGVALCRRIVRSGNRLLIPTGEGVSLPAFGRLMLAHKGCGVPHDRRRLCAKAVLRLHAKTVLRRSLLWGRPLWLGGRRCRPRSRVRLRPCCRRLRKRHVLIQPGRRRERIGRHGR